MKFPEIGEIVYGFQSKQDRIGETTFLCTTQCHVTSDVKEGTEEMLENLCYLGEEQIEDEIINAYDPKKGSELIIWEMKRIR